MAKYFTPKMIAIHIIAISFIVICGLFAQWQWARAHFTRIPQSSSAPIPFGELSVPKDYLPVSSIGAQTVVQGTWQPGSRFLLSQRPANGQLLIDTPANNSAMQTAQKGYWIVDLLQLPDQSAVAVVRGWSAKKPDAAVPRSSTTVTGTVQPAEDSPGSNLISTPEQLTTKFILQHSSTDVRDGFIVAENAINDTVAVTPTREPATSDGLHWRNVVYTLNWIFFALLAIPMWVRVVRQELLDTPTEN